MDLTAPKQKPVLEAAWAFYPLHQVALNFQLRRVAHLLDLRPTRLNQKALVILGENLHRLRLGNVHYLYVGKSFH